MLSRARFLSSESRDVPRRPRGVGRGEHLVPSPGVVVPAAVGLEVHGRELPDLAAVVDAALRAGGSAPPGSTSSQYLIRMIPESTIAFSTAGTISRKRRVSSSRAEAHHPLDAGPVVPAAVEDHDLPGRREVREVALDVHLGLLPLGRGRQRDDAEDPRAHPLGDGLDHAALAGAVPTLEHDADLGARRHHPLLEVHQFDLQHGQFALVVLARELLGVVGLAMGLLLLGHLGKIVPRPVRVAQGSWSHRGQVEVEVEGDEVESGGGSREPVPFQRDLGISDPDSTGMGPTGRLSAASAAPVRSRVVTRVAPMVDRTACYGPPHAAELAVRRARRTGCARPAPCAVSGGWRRCGGSHAPRPAGGGA